MGEEKKKKKRTTCGSELEFTANEKNAGLYNNVARWPYVKTTPHFRSFPQGMPVT